MIKEMNHKILIVDDEPQMRKFLQVGLDVNQYATSEAASGQEAIKQCVSGKPDLVILDLGLPDEDGLDIITRIREWSKIPIVVLSVRGDESDKIEAFERGANDYVTKPFGMGELLARVKASLRDSIQQEYEEVVLTAGDLKVDLLKHLVTVRDKRVHLSPKEFKLLKVFMKHVGKVITHKQLIKEVWGEAYGDDNQYLRIYIRQLRRKLEFDPKLDKYIFSEPGIGYRMEVREAIL